MAAASNDALSHQDPCAICMEGLAARITVTLRCRHTFHLDCLGSAFNAANQMRCPVCRAVEEGVWRTFPTRAPRRPRADALVLQESAQEPPVRMQPTSGIYGNLDQGWFSGSLSLGNGGPIRHPYSFQYRRRETTHMMMGSVNGSGVTRITHLRLDVYRRLNYRNSFHCNVGPNEHYDPLPQEVNRIQAVGLEALDVAFSGDPISNNSAGSLFGRLAGAAPVGWSMDVLPSPPARAVIHTPNSRFSSSGLLPAEQMTFQVDGSRMANVQLPDVGEVLPLSTDVQPGDGIDDSENILSDGEESV